MNLIRKLRKLANFIKQGFYGQIFTQGFLTRSIFNTLVLKNGHDLRIRITTHGNVRVYGYGGEDFERLDVSLNTFLKLKEFRILYAEGNDLFFYLATASGEEVTADLGELGKVKVPTQNKPFDFAVPFIFVDKRVIEIPAKSILNYAPGEYFRSKGKYYAYVSEEKIVRTAQAKFIVVAIDLKASHEDLEQLFKEKPEIFRVIKTHRTIVKLNSLSEIDNLPQLEKLNLSRQV